MLRRPRWENESRKLYLKRTFRLLVRLVILNKKWLPDWAGQKIGLNVRRNIILLVRPQSSVSLLTLYDKRLLHTAHWARTKEEKKRLVTLVSSLKCFEQYPPKFRARLVPIIHHMQLDEQKEVMKEGYSPINVYFILTGEVVLLKRINNVDEVRFICGPGSSLGDIEVVEKKRRLYSGRTASPTEFLTIFVDEYRRILLPYMKRQNEQKKQVMQMFNCFKHWTDEQVCFVLQFGVCKEFNPLETIFFEDKGLLNMVYFMVSGETMMLQCLRIRYFNKNPDHPPELCALEEGDSKLMLERLSDTELLKRFNEENIRNERDQQFLANVELSDYSESSSSSEIPGIPSALKKDETAKYNSPCGIQLRPDLADSQMMQEIMYQYSSNETNTSLEDLQRRSNSLTAKSQIRFHRFEVPDQRFSGQQHTQSISAVASSYKRSLKKSRISQRKGKYTLENVFIDAGSYTSGAIFGLGEKMENRAIIARTTVQCLMLPRFWLFKKEQNVGNYWSRIRNNLNGVIPTREELFRDFVRTKNWLKYKNEYISFVVNQRPNGNPTQVNDIPIMCRIFENL